MPLPIRDELRLMLAPARTYQRLLADPSPRTGARALLTRPALIALTIGGFITLSNAGELLPTLLAGTTLAWAFVPILQALIATPLIALCRHLRRPTTPSPPTAPRLHLSSALDLFFASHGPWSLWLLALTAFSLSQMPVGLDAAREVRMVALSALIAIGWTVVILIAYARTVLALPLAGALAFTFVYEAAIWACAYLYLGAVTFRVSPFSLYPAWLP
jgi:hypothetical protein